MSTTTASPAGFARLGTARLDMIARWGAAGAALLLLLLAMSQPLWQATLNAPQYPGGLKMIAYGDQVKGDITEINNLNHYIGMKPLKWNEIPERVLWKPGLAVAAIAIVVTALTRRRAVRRIACTAMWLFPLGVIADIQFRLYQYGHDLDEGAALRIPKFTVWVFGPTKVWNFSTWSYPGLGLIFLFLAAAAVTFIPMIVRRIRPGAAAAVGTTSLLLLGVLAGPAVATEDPAHSEHPVATTDLQAMFDDPSFGEHLLLEAGTYHGSFTIDRPMMVHAEGVVLHGDGAGSVLTITSDDVRIIGLSVTNSAPGPVGSPAGIDILGARNVELLNVSVSDSYLGISVEASKDVVIGSATITGRGGNLGDTEHAMADHGSQGRSTGRDDMAEGRGDGIALINSKRILVRGSKLSTVRDGIYLSFSDHVMIDGNSIVDGRYGLHTMYANDLTISSNRVERNVAGLVMMYGGKMLAIDNHLVDNTSASTGFGLLVKDVLEVEVAKNVIVGNRVGIHIEGAPGATPETQRFVLNTIALNAVGAAVLPSAVGTFSGNSFVENQVQVVPVGSKVAPSVRWTEHGAGNYWSDYRGFDRTDDGVGDAPHRETGLTSRLLDENPGLYALLGSPALGLATSSHEKWAPSNVGIVDELPLMEPHSPKAHLPATGDERSLFFLSAFVLVLSVAALLFGAVVRRPRKVAAFLPRQVADDIA